MFCFRSRNLKELLQYELQFWCSNQLYNQSQTHKPNLVHSASVVNNFSTCHCFFRQTLENVENFNSNKMVVKKDGTIKKKKKPTGVKVYLVNENGISSSMFLHEAEKLAHRQRLALKKVDEVNGIASYKLVSISDMLEVNENLTENKKANDKVKKLIISGDIKPHDLEIKISHIKKFLGKGMNVLVRVGDRNTEPTKLKTLNSEMEKALADGSFKISKSGNNVSIVPTQKTDAEEKKQ